MAAITFDALSYFEKLKIAGMPEEQAKVQVEAMQDIVKTYDEASRKELATKGDIQDVRNEMEKMELRLKHDLTLRLGGMMAASIAAVAALIKLL